MADNTALPSALEDTLAEVNPYEIPDKIWSLIEGYFKKYNVVLSESFPMGKVDKPTIIANVVKRTGGRSNSSVHGKGPNFVRFLKSDTAGMVHEIHIQQQEMAVEYTIYATSTAEVKRIAWDLEQAVLETTGILQQEIEGFQMHFDQQLVDSSMLSRQQDEMIRRTLRFHVLLPVKFVKLIPELRMVEIVHEWGVKCVNNAELERDSNELIFAIPVETGQRVANISGVFLKAGEYPYKWEQLRQNTDYRLIRRSDNNVVISWNDDFGKTPSVGQTFRVDYDLSHKVVSNTIR